MPSLEIVQTFYLPFSWQFLSYEFHSSLCTGWCLHDYKVHYVALYQTLPPSNKKTVCYLCSKFHIHSWKYNVSAIVLIAPTSQTIKTMVSTPPKLTINGMNSFFLWFHHACVFCSPTALFENDLASVLPPLMWLALGEPLGGTTRSSVLSIKTTNGEKTHYAPLNHSPGYSTDQGKCTKHV